MRPPVAATAFLLLLLAAGCNGGSGTTPVPAAVFLSQGLKGVFQRLVREPAPAVANAITRTALSPDGGRLATGDRAGGLRVVDVARQSTLLRQTLAGDPARFTGTPHEGFANGNGPSVTGLAFLAGGTKLLAAVGAGTVARFDVATGVREASAELAVPVAALDVDEANDRLIVGTDLGGLVEFVLSTFAAGRTFRAEDFAGSVRFVRFVEAGAKLLGALEDYEPSQDADALPPGPTANAGLTRWTVATAARDVRFGAPAGTAGAIQHDGLDLVLAGSSTGQGARFDRAGVLQPGEFEAYDAIGLLVAGGKEFAATASRRTVHVLLLPDLERVATLVDAANPSPLLPEAFSTAPATDTFAVGRADGSFEVYRFVPGGDEASRVVARALPIGSALGASVAQLREFYMHSVEIVEVTVSPSGRYVLTRDITGKAALVDLTPPGAPAPASAAGSPALAGLASPQIHTLPATFDRCPARLPVFSFGPGEMSFLAVQGDGTLHRFSLPDAAPLGSLTIFGPGGPVRPIAALDVTPDELLIGGDDSGLYVAHPVGGTVFQTLSFPQGGASPKPFTTLLRMPDGQRVLCAPSEYVPGDGDQEVIRTYRISDWSIDQLCFQRYKGGRFCAPDGGMLVVQTETYERREMNLFTADVFDKLGSLRKAAPRAGLTPILGNLLLGTDPTTLHIFRADAGGFQAGAIPHALGRATALGGSEATRRAYVGLASGGLIELDVQ